MRPPTDADGVLILSLSRRDDVVTPGSSLAATVNDANVLTITPATTDTAWDVVASAVHLGRIVSAVVTCTGTGAIASGRLTRVSDGDCVVTAKSGMFIKKETVSMLRASGQTVNQWQSWVTGCLAGAIEQTTNVDLPFWRGSGYGFTAISPRHVIGCEHINYMPPTLTLGGVTRNLVSSTIVGPANGSDGWKSDLMVGKYDGDFPSYAKVFPSTLYSYLPSLSLKGVPAIVCNQFGEKIQRLTGIVSSSQSKLSLAKINESDTSIIGGDSGNPAFLVLDDDEPVLLGTLTQGGSGGITTIHDQITEVNAAMTELGGGYQLTQVNLTGYPSY
ncbi:hypothetical protein E6Q11_00935 [Candidatus Dojkabacteria bacterium]|uniref:Serine protease n=1 Tax=Candidatus Dojkabacteria bacterium TaxID=2099670 RepID=A0A5C7JD46_9BACT|nr:MAG: hypothetical protein E6Q11_00935 [Candidatus Dojkabacteria bacterium]